MSKSGRPIIEQVMIEEGQGHETRKDIIVKLEKELGLPVVSFFTSFRYPVMIDDSDADMLEGILRKMDLSKGLVFMVSSPGGIALAAERIINTLRSNSGIKKFEAVVSGKAKSAATLVCFGASKIYMSQTSELGAVDPQMAVSEDGQTKRYSVFNVVESYKELFQRACEAKGNIEPYLQQLANYNEKEIKEMKSELELSEDISIRALHTGMMEGNNEKIIKKNIAIFLTPEKTKTHGRPIYIDEAIKSKLQIEEIDLYSTIGNLIYELHVRTNHFVNSKASKCFESKDHMFIVPPPKFD